MGVGVIRIAYKIVGKEHDRNIARLGVCLTFFPLLTYTMTLPSLLNAFP